MSDVRVNRTLVIPADEMEFRFSPAGGPGGQHANRSATRVELSWNVAESRALGPRQRQRLLRNLEHRLDSSGTLRLRSGTRRSQLRNREEVERRLATIVSDALRVAKPRVATQPSAAARRRRLEAKRRRGEIKRGRREPVAD